MSIEQKIALGYLIIVMIAIPIAGRGYARYYRKRGHGPYSHEVTAFSGGLLAGFMWPVMVIIGVCSAATWIAERISVPQFLRKIVTGE